MNPLNSVTRPAGWKFFLKQQLTRRLRAVRPRGTEPRGLRILLYHAIGQPAFRDRTGLYSIPPSAWQEHLTCFSAGYFFDLRNLAQGTPFPNSHLALTFDDGYSGLMTQAFPVLQELKIPCAVFLVADFARRGRDGFLGRGELAQLGGFPDVAIGSHGMTHRPLADLSEREVREELSGSRKVLEDMTGRPVDMISYPFGSHNRRVEDCAREAGYRLGFGSRAGINGDLKEPMRLRRTDILASDGKETLEEKLRGDWDWSGWP